MKTLILVNFFSLACYAQQGERSMVPQPSAMMTTTLPAQDISITIRVSSEIATALEKRRLDHYTVVPAPDGQSSILKAALPTIADQLVFDIQQAYFSPLLARYPSKIVKDAQDAATKAQQAAQEAANKASVVTKK